MPIVDFALPELGENVAGGDVLRVLVKPGEMVRREQPVVELETDKATFEVPSSVEGRVVDVRVAPGQRVKVGDVVVTVDVPHAAEAAGAAPPGAAAPAAAAPTPDGPEAALDEVVRQAAGPRAADVTAVPEASSAPVEFTLPSLGENVPGGDVLRVLVRAGDTLVRDQPVLELETDKATFEVPSSVAGRVLEVRAMEGARINVGDVVLVFEAGQGTAVPAVPAVKFQRVHAAPAPAGAAGAADAGPAVARPAEDKPGMLEDALAEARAQTSPRGERGALVTMPPRGGDSSVPLRAAPAAPSVRRVARELGVDIHQVPGSGPAGRISSDDVKAFVKRVMSSGGPRPAAPTAAAAAAPPLPDFAKWGRVERRPMRAVRRKTAEHLAHAWAQIPHVTQFDKADVTALEDLRKRHAKEAEAAGGKLTMTAILVKAIGAALEAFPQFNASLDMATEEVVLKKYVHVGIAVDTDRGLLVPVIRDVNQKNIVELSVELAQASEKARAGKTTLEEMQGGCMTITNLGGIGGTAFTPIVNHPEVAILGVSRAAFEPVYVDGAFQPRLMLPLSLSYDHRAIDGADGIRFLRWICEALEQPFLLSLRG
jgi:pyruvate dehydrogenase E2 component (dihydrolipoamide acetyltransferase)